MTARPAFAFVSQLLAFLALALCLAASAPAQTGPQDLANELSAWTADLERVEKTLERGDLADATLVLLRGELEAAREKAGKFAEQIRQRLDAARSQLDKLGPAPKAEEPAESETAARERQQLNQLVSSLDGAIRTAEVLQTRAGQLADAVQERRSTLFSEQLFKRVESPLSPDLWTQARRDLGMRIVMLRVLLDDWGNAIRTPGLLIALLAAAGAIWLLLRRLAAGFIARYRAASGDEPPAFLRRTASAAGVAFARAMPPIAAAGAFYLGLVALDMAPGRIRDLALAALCALAVTAALTALITTMLAPGEPHWRIFPVPDREARFLRWFAAGIAIVYGLDLFLSDFNRTLVAPLTITVTQKSVATVIMALLLAALLTVGGGEPQERTRLSTAWRCVRLFLWGVVLLVLAATALGYVAFANFLISQVAISGALLSVLYLLHVAITELSDGITGTETRTGRWLSLAPHRREQVALLLSLLLYGLLVAATIPLLMLQWGFDWEDVRQRLGNVLFGFQIGSFNISIATILAALLLFVVGIIATRFFQHWLDSRVLRRSGLEQGARAALGTVIGYLGIVLAALVAFAYTGLDFSNIAIVAGALSVGIGFGLQSIVNNFVSGLILLAERRINVGDWILVGADEGHVRRISVRATEIETFDRSYVIIPNAELITNTVTSRTFRHRRGRVVIPVRVSYDSDADRVSDILTACAAANPEVISNPAPRVSFEEFGDNALMFSLIAFVADVDSLGDVRSDLRFAILRAFREAGIEMPYPQRDLHLKDIDRLERAIAGRVSAPRARPASERRAETQGSGADGGKGGADRP